MCLPDCAVTECGDGYSCLEGACIPAAVSSPADAGTSEDAGLDVVTPDAVGGDATDAGDGGGERGCREDGDQVCSQTVGRGAPNTLLVCEDGALSPRTDCEFACVQLNPAEAACAERPCPGPGSFCAEELGLPEGFIYRCTEGGVEVGPPCRRCVPGRGAPAECTDR